MQETSEKQTPQERYIQLEAGLHLAEREESAAEVHGLIIGSVTNHLFTGVKPQLMLLLLGEESVEGMQALEPLVYELYREASDLLFNSDDLFDLLLPDDDESVALRTDALASWCQGYMLGLLYHESLAIDQLPEEGPEIARDIMSISQAGPSEGDDAEKDEWALAELHEYVKVGVQLIFEFIYQARAAAQPTTTPQQ